MGISLSAIGALFLRNRIDRNHLIGQIKEFRNELNSLEFQRLEVESRIEDAKKREIQVNQFEISAIEFNIRDQYIDGLRSKLKELNRRTQASKESLDESIKRFEEKEKEASLLEKFEKTNQATLQAENSLANERHLDDLLTSQSLSGIDRLGKTSNDRRNER